MGATIAPSKPQNSTPQAKLSALAARAVRAARGREYTTPVLDLLTGTPVIAVGFTKMKAAYAGQCCNVRRGSDSATIDIPFGPDGIVDTAKMRAFAQGSQLFMVTFYDQSGSANNLTQATAVNQPLIDLVYPRNGAPTMVCTNTQFLNLPAVAITSTQNCAVWTAIGGLSNRTGQRLWNLGTAGQFALELSPISAFSVQLANTGTNTNPWATMQTVPNANGCVAGLNSSASNVTLFRNSFSASGAATAAVAPTGGTLPGTSVASPDIYAFLLFNAALSAEDAERLQYGLGAAYDLVQAPVANVVLQGDSRTAGVVPNGYNYNKGLLSYLPPSVSVYNLGLGGQTMQTEVGEMSSYLTPLVKTGIANVSAMLGGINDILLSGKTNIDLQGYVTTWASTVKAAGFKAVAATLVHLAVTGSYTSTMDGYVTAYNAWLRGNFGPGKILDGIADFDLEPTFLPNVATADFPDNLHPNLQGYQKCAPILANAIAPFIVGV